MPANIRNRENVRDEVSVLMTASLVTSEAVVEVVYNHIRRTFTGQSPVVIVSSGGWAPSIMGQGTSRFRTDVFIELLTFVADGNFVVGWTEAIVEDTLDDIARLMANVIGDNQTNANWNHLQFSGPPSGIIPLAIGGNPYRMERHVLLAEVNDV